MTAFRPARWTRNPHLQTLWGPLLRRRRLRLRRQRLTTADGDFVDLDRHDGPGGSPLVLVLHGLEGSSRSHYVVGLVQAAAARGWRAVVLHFRSCSGELNRLPRFYHSGDTGDLETVVRALLAEEPEAHLGVVGVSIGGNVLLKWLGERQEAVPPQVEGAVAISTPFDLTACAAVMDRGFQRAVYTRSFLRTMKAKTRRKARVYPGFVDLPAVLRARTFAEYDRAMTAPVHGFADERDYWARASSAPYLGRIRRPTLLINALDDPFVPAASLPAPDLLPPWVETAFTPHGGHVGFLEGRWPWRLTSWAERHAVDWLAGVLKPAGGDHA